MISRLIRICSILFHSEPIKAYLVYNIGLENLWSSKSQYPFQIKTILWYCQNNNGNLHDKLLNIFYGQVNIWAVSQRYTLNWVVLYFLGRRSEWVIPLGHHSLVGLNLCIGAMCLMEFCSIDLDVIERTKSLYICVLLTACCNPLY